MADRSTRTVTTTNVRHVAKPMGAARESGPHLADLRAFVTACEGLPDDVLVRVTYGHLSESGRQDVEISVSYRHPADTESEAPDVPR